MRGTPGLPQANTGVGAALRDPARSLTFAWNSGLNVRRGVDGWTPFTVLASP